MTVDEAGEETWHDDGSNGLSNYNQSRIEYASSSSQGSISFTINQLLCQEPRGDFSQTEWVEGKGENCYGPRSGDQQSHGATDLEDPPESSCGTMTLTECQQMCLDMQGCTAVTASPADARRRLSAPNKSVDPMVHCYRKSDVFFGQCDQSTSSFSTYVRREWVLARGFNCYGPRGGDPSSHGAVDLETPPDADCGVMTIQECQETCEVTEGCMGVVVKGSEDSSQGNCYRKASIDLSKCDVGTGFDTYIRSTNKLNETIISGR